VSASVSASASASASASVCVFLVRWYMYVCECNAVMNKLHDCGVQWRGGRMQEVVVVFVMR